VSRTSDSSRSARIFIALSLANLTYAVSQTLLIPAIPDIQHHVHATSVGATSLMSVFFLTGAVTAGLAGRLGDMIGKQRILIAQLCLFTAGALVCSLATSLPFLILGRAVMGFAAALFPLSASIVRDELTGRWVTHGIGFLGATIGIGSAFGLACGGLITDHLGYHWIFWIPFAMGAASLIAVSLLVPESSVKSPGRIDVLGAALFGAGLGCPLVAISRTPVWGWGSSRTALLVAAGVVLLVAFVAHERRHPEPLLDFAILTRPEVALTNAATFLVGFGIFGAGVILTQFFQEPKSTGYGFGASAAQAGFFLAPGTALMLLSAPLSGMMASRGGPKAALLAGTGISSVALGLMAGFHKGTLVLFLWPALLYVGNGFSFAAMPMLILNAVPPHKRGEATSINQIFRLVGSSIGTQLAATFIASSTARSGPPAESGFTHAFIIEAVGGFSAFLVALTIPGRLRARRLRGDAASAAESVGSAAPLS
jgi:EmrB/QacA subfamily drug resistance transporter